MSPDREPTPDPLRPPRHSEAAVAAAAVPLGTFHPYERRWTGPQDGPVPRGNHHGIDLSQVVPERWADLLRPLTARERFNSQYAVILHPLEQADVTALVAALPPPPNELAERAMQAGPISLPFGAVADRPGTRQLNVRLSVEDHRLLVAAAHIAGTKPTTLSRMLILGGMRKILAEHGRHYGVDAD